jgi:hypothetical protein
VPPLTEDSVTQDISTGIGQTIVLTADAWMDSFLRVQIVRCKINLMG